MKYMMTFAALLAALACGPVMAGDSTSLTTENVTAQSTSSSTATGSRGMWSPMKGKTASCVNGSYSGNATVDANGDLQTYVNQNGGTGTCTNPQGGLCYKSGSTTTFSRTDIFGIAVYNSTTLICSGAWPVN